MIQLMPFNNLNSSLPVSKKKPSLWGVVVASAAVVLAVTILISTQGLDAVLRLFGVGASGIYEVSLSSTYDWLGTGSNPAVIGGAESLDGANVFAQFSSVPNDPHTDAKSLGLITSIFSSTDPTQETYQQHVYISPPLDLGETAPYLNAIEVVDYSPESADINYFYKTSPTKEALANAVFVPVDLTLSNDLENQVKVRTAVIDQTVSRYAQVKIELINNTFTQRSAVYAFTFQYKPTAPVSGSVSQGADAIARNITVNYSVPGAPDAADIDIVSSDVTNAIVYSAQGINLAQSEQGYVFKANLVPGAYALTISAPQLETRIIPFLVSNKKDIEINAGSFAVSTGLPVNDLNGDGVINSIDFLLLQ